MSEKVLYILEKPRGKKYIKVIVDPEDEDEWFILFQWIDRKSEKVDHQSIVIRKDIPGWIQYLTESLGWKIKTNNLT
jgi:hypothetical protein